MRLYTESEIKKIEQRAYDLGRMNGAMLSDEERNVVINGYCYGYYAGDDGTSDFGGMIPLPNTELERIREGLKRGLRQLDEYRHHEWRKRNQS